MNEQAPTPGNGPKPLVAAAWLTIVVMVAAAAALQAWRSGAQDEGAARELVLRQQEMAGQMLYAAGQLGGPAAQSMGAMDKNLEQMNGGPLLMRVRHAALVALLKTPEDGLAVLDEALAAAPESAKDEEALAAAEALRAQLTGGAAGDPSVPAPGLGWFGRALAVGDDDAARQALVGPAFAKIVVLGLAAIGGILALIGGVIGVLVLMFRRKPGSSFHFRAGLGGGGFAAEAFALWLLLFSVVSVVLGLALQRNPGVQMGVLVAAIPLCALLAVGWLGARGVPVPTSRDMVGMGAGWLAPREWLAGIGGYAMCLPFICAGLGITLALQFAVHGNGAVNPGDWNWPDIQGAHPAALEVLNAGPWMLVALFLVASVAAPFAEELVFRGLLYRHLREATAGWSRAAGMIASGLLTGLVFASIHPQGWIAIPALTSIAFGLAFVREWRGSILPCMIAHGINNAFVLGFAVLMFRS